MFFPSKRNGVKQEKAKLLISQIHLKINSDLRVLAKYMELKSNEFTDKGKWAFLIGFVVCTGSISFYILIESFVAPAQKRMDITFVQRPGFIILRDEENIFSSNTHDYKSLRALILNADSMSSGIDMPIMNSLLTFRPQLMDTLNLLESIYQKQQKKMSWKRKQMQPGF